MCVLSILSSIELSWPKPHLAIEFTLTPLTWQTKVLTLTDGQRPGSANDIALSKRRSESCDLGLCLVGGEVRARTFRLLATKLAANFVRAPIECRLAEAMTLHALRNAKNGHCPVTSRPSRIEFNE
jgi:hypothetical protein